MSSEADTNSADRSPSRPTPTPVAARLDSPLKGEGTRAGHLLDTRRILSEAGIETAALDARLLLLHALGIGATELVMRPDEPVTPAQGSALAALTARRLTHEPMARILGEREFWGLPFRLSPETLVPRPDTETVVATALELFPEWDRPLRIVDLGTGSGCILVSLLHERPRSHGVGVDLSPGALRTARRNAVLNGVGDQARFLASNWADAVSGTFDLVVSNPPYIASAVVETLDAEVRHHDPRLALDGGPDGLEPYRILFREAPRLLKAGGAMVLEIGYDQAEAISRLAGAAGLEIVALRHDLGGNPRCVAVKAT
ncbi:peptide chain release factor N(5)-glutamine methyltransferase [Microvirga pudoricolor]|uniref:peptide chain release factor N(5)-glutamine methyltransferase n=1 Tax=Microvirga pudoricolor TaxID=2778729 RepID=UPI00194E3657|nr:peptide chain release factor N(5)-glutamine methyltransferase [Microvirga pudoricolor]MBM6593407.1 peptide chain release factor N(5)-glutamine methyltransferase [Microvirga pudoricolor]